MIPPIYNHSFTIPADLDVPAAGAEGVIVAEADVMGGFSLYVQDGKLRYTYSFLGVKVETLTAPGPCRPARSQVRYQFAADRRASRPRGAAAGCSSTVSRSPRAGSNRPSPTRFTHLRRHGYRPDNGEPVSPLTATSPRSPSRGRSARWSSSSSPATSSP